MLNVSICIQGRDICGIHAGSDCAGRVLKFIMASIRSKARVCVGVRVCEGGGGGSITIIITKCKNAE